MIELRDVTVGYRGVPLIGGINLKVAPGEVVTLVGPNGSGKSTILKTATGHLAPLGGTVLLQGSDLSAQPAALVARQLAVMLTDHLQPELMTCYDIAAAGRYPYTGRLGILSPEDHGIVEQALRDVDAWELADRPFNEISDGQRQRVLLARAFAQQPQAIVLDEPTSFLDIRYKLELLTVLRALARERDIAVLMSLHEVDLACKASDRIACVAPGAVTRVAEPDELLREGALISLFGLEDATIDPRFDELVSRMCHSSDD